MTYSSPKLRLDSRGIGPFLSRKCKVEGQDDRSGSLMIVLTVLQEVKFQFLNTGAYDLALFIRQRHI